MQKLNKNIINYKVSKCKNFERTGQCKYGSHCSFAHGDAELRVKNPMFGGNMFDPMAMGMGMMPYPGMDYQQQMMANQMMMQDPNAMMMMGQPMMPMDGMQMGNPQINIPQNNDNPSAPGANAEH